MSFLPPNEVSMSSRYEVLWRCDRKINGKKAKGHIFAKTPAHRDVESPKNNGCPFCKAEREKENKVLRNTRVNTKSSVPSLLKKYPKLASEYSKDNPIPVDKIAHNSPDLVKWFRSECGHEWSTMLSSRTHKDSGCPVCVRKKTMSSNYTFINSLNP